MPHDRLSDDIQDGLEHMAPAPPPASAEWEVPFAKLLGALEDAYEEWDYLRQHDEGDPREISQRIIAARAALTAHVAALEADNARLLAGYQDVETPTDIRVLKESNARFAFMEHEIETAVREFCPVENLEGNEDLGVPYICLNEDGDPIIQSDTVADAIRQMGQCWSSENQRANKAEQKLAEAELELADLDERILAHSGKGIMGYPLGSHYLLTPEAAEEVAQRRETRGVREGLEQAAKAQCYYCRERPGEFGPAEATQDGRWIHRAPHPYVGAWCDASAIRALAAHPAGEGEANMEKNHG